MGLGVPPVEKQKVESTGGVGGMSGYEPAQEPHGSLAKVTHGHT